MARPAGIKYVSLAETSGYGVAARRCMLGLIASGVPFTWAPMVCTPGGPTYYSAFGGAAVGDAQLDPYCNRRIDYDLVIVHTVPEYFPHWVEAERGRRVVGHTVWETTALPAHWPALLNSVDHLLVPSAWNRSVFERCGVTVPIGVLPHVVERPAGMRRPAEADGPTEFTFYTVGTWTVRRALDLTVRAFCEAFTADDPVRLVIKTSAVDFTARSFFRRVRRTTRTALARVTRGYRRPPPIDLVTEEISDDAIRALHRRGHCYVSLCRSEGWGLGAFDAAAHGNPIVMTGFGGQLDYLDPELAWLVPYALVPVVDRRAPGSYSSAQQWAEPNIAAGATAMRQVFEHQEEARRRALALQRRVLADYDAALLTDRLIGMLDRVSVRNPVSRLSAR